MKLMKLQQLEGFRLEFKQELPKVLFVWNDFIQQSGLVPEHDNNQIGLAIGTKLGPSWD